MLAEPIATLPLPATVKAGREVDDKTDSKLLLEVPIINNVLVALLNIAEVVPIATPAVLVANQILAPLVVHCEAGPPVPLPSPKELVLTQRVLVPAERITMPLVPIVLAPS